MATQSHICFATLKAQLINEFLNHRRFLAFHWRWMFKQSNVHCFQYSSPKKSSKATMIDKLIDELSLKICSARCKVKSLCFKFCRTYKLLCTHLVSIEIRNGREVGPCLDTTYTVIKALEFWNLRIPSTTTPTVFFSESDDGPRTIPAAGEWIPIDYRYTDDDDTRFVPGNIALLIEMRSQKTGATNLICESNFKIP